jgi:Domain of unknown function (DUF6089)
MNRLISLIVLLIVSVSLSAQKLHIGVFGGLAAYNGDLTEKIFPKKVTNGAVGITGNYEITEHIMARGGITYAVVGGADRFSDKADARLRNLSFETSILEFSALGEYYLLDLNVSKISPYVYTGLAVFHYNPYAYDLNKNKIFLQPLSTEGQGLSGYPNKPYKLTQWAIPFGGGVKFAVNDNLRIGIEGGIRKLFTDYLDDVSTSFPAQADLLAAKGQTAVDISYRGDEVGGSATYPAKGAQRGGAKNKDYYYFTGIHVTYRMGGGEGGYGGRAGGRGRTGCPVNVY